MNSIQLCSHSNDSTQWLCLHRTDQVRAPLQSLNALLVGSAVAPHDQMQRLSVGDIHASETPCWHPAGGKTWCSNLQAECNRHTAPDKQPASAGAPQHPCQHLQPHMLGVSQRALVPWYTENVCRLSPQGVSALWHMSCPWYCGWGGHSCWGPERQLQAQADAALDCSMTVSMNLCEHECLRA